MNFKAELTCPVDGSPNRKSTKRYKIDCLPEDFMFSEICQMSIQNIIAQIEYCRETQKEIDKIYDDIVDMLKT